MDAWVLALGAPIKVSRSPLTRTEVSLKERAEARAFWKASLGPEESQETTPWRSNDAAQHIVFIGQAGRADRELVAAIDATDAVRMVAEKAVAANKRSRSIVTAA